MKEADHFQKRLKIMNKLTAEEIYYLMFLGRTFEYAAKETI